VSDQGSDASQGVQAHVLIVRSSTERNVSLYVVAAADRTTAVRLVQEALGPYTSVEPHGHPLSEEVARGLGLNIGEVRKF
jgi:hypothetical protein